MKRKPGDFLVRSVPAIYCGYIDRFLPLYIAIQIGVPFGAHS
jgi:hypothetical protein